MATCLSVSAVEEGANLILFKILGLIFLNLGNQGSRMFDHLKFCIGVVIIIAYTQVMVPILSCEYE